jgi:hypothetical protein
LIALAALTIAAPAQQRTIYSNDGNVIGRYATDSPSTTTLYDRNGRVISRATGNTVIMHDGMSACRVWCPMAQINRLDCRIDARVG